MSRRSTSPKTAAEACDVAGMAVGFRRRLETEDMVRLHDEIETPLVRVLAKMEVAGIGVDRAELQRHRRLAQRPGRHPPRPRSSAPAGRDFNVNSTPATTGGALRGARPDPGQEDQDGLLDRRPDAREPAGAHPIVDALLDYREVEKLRSTYGESLLAEVPRTVASTPSFGQTVARTGRISSDRPNLHNIPVRTELGKQFRRAFVPAEGCTFLVADYDQVELRCIAHLSEDPGLIDAFDVGSDVHRMVAAAVYGVAPDEVTHTQREFAKMVSYGLAYGMEAYGLSQRLDVAVEEAAAIMESYFGAFPPSAVHGRRGGRGHDRGPDPHPVRPGAPVARPARPNYRVRQAAERQAMNAGIQGLAADIFKLALVASTATSRRRGGQPPGAPGPRRGPRRGGRRRGGRRPAPHRAALSGAAEPQGAPHHLCDDRRAGPTPRDRPPGLVGQG